MRLKLARNRESRLKEQRAKPPAATPMKTNVRHGGPWKSRLSNLRSAIVHPDSWRSTTMPLRARNGLLRLARRLCYRSWKSGAQDRDRVAYGEKGRQTGSRKLVDDHPLLRRPADMPLMVSWIPVSTFSLAARERCSLRSSTCTWL